MNKDISQLLQASIPFLSTLVFASPALAQITPDDTVPTQVNQSGNVTEITGGAEKGNNLFHSFKEFSVLSGNEAFFNNATNIENIFSRVTGGSLSNIDGLIRANGSANLFLINPAGILFGANARLNIGGSFYGSTADSLLFDEGIEFSAVNPQNPILTINAPIGLRFRDNPAPITYRSLAVDEMGMLIPAVKSNQTFAFIGGDINIQDGILGVAPEAKIELGGLSELGIVEILEDGSLRFPDGIERADISLIGAANIIIDGAVETSGLTINARNLELFGNSVIIVATSNISQVQDRAIITINASDRVALFNQALILGQLNGDAVDKVRAIDINTRSLEVISDLSSEESDSPARIVAVGSAINSLPQNEIDILNINASDKIIVDKGLIAGEVFTGGVQRANINITTGSFELTNDALVYLNNFITPGEVADTGKLSINADIILVDNSILGTGLGATALVNTDTNVEIKPNSVEKVNSVEVVNGGEINANSPGFGDAGSVIINTDRLTVKDNSEISVNSVAGGSAGNLTITANSVNLDQGILTASTEAESGGNIILDVDDNIFLRNNSQITAQATGDADGGDINIEADLIIASSNQNSDILASAGQQGTGGRIEINAEGIFGLEVRPPNNTTNDIDASGGVDGEVIINTPDVDISKGAIETPQNVLVLEQIVAQACSSDGIARGNSTLIVSGKGGVPPKLIAPIRSDAIYIEGETVNTQVEIAKKNLYADINNKKENKARDIVTLVENNQPVTIDDIIPAQGAIILENGDVILTAYPTPNSGDRFPDARKNCAI